MFSYAALTRHTTPEVLAAVAAAHPEREFVVAEDGRATYAEVAYRAASIAAKLQSGGVGPGDRVGIALPNGLRWVAALLGVHAAGATAVPLNSWFKPAEMAGVLSRAAPIVIYAEPEIAERTGLTDFPRLGKWRRGEILPDGRDGPRPGDPLRSLLDSPCTENDIALLLFTSGSSAEPKAVQLTQGGMVRTAHAVGERQGVRAEDRFWFSLPLFFVFGCSNALPNALTHAATLCLQERFEPASALEFLERERCTVYYGVAPITRALAAHPDLANRDISALRTGTANATAEDLRIAIEVLGVTEVCNAYGMTEGHGHSTITAHTDPPEVRMTSQGTALPTQEVRVVDEDGAPVPAGSTGHIQIRGTITPGYLDSPEVNAFDADGWFRTGDLGWLDDVGRMHYVGRSYEMIKAKGINISPAEVETLLVQHPDVDEAFVFGVDTDTGDQDVGAVLVSTTTDTDQLSKDVTAWAREQISSYKVPRLTWVLTADQLPLTPTGKVSKRLLRDQVLRASVIRPGT